MTRRIAAAGHGFVRVGRGTARSTKAAVQGTARGAREVGRAARRLTHAQGAGRTGLGRLIELTAGSGAGDALITGALATTVLFGLPVGEARGSVALYLVITMIPFALVAPFVGPILDRLRSGRRYVMAGTLFGRGLLGFAMAAAVGPGDLVTLFAAALGALVLSKAYHVSRAAIMPSVLPAGVSLVSANARVALFSLVAAGAAVPVAAGLASWLGAAWALRLATAVFIVAGVHAVRLPRHVDSPEPEPGPETTSEDESPAPARWRTILNAGPAVTDSMLANVGIRVFSGFLLFFLLFLVQEGHVPGMRSATSQTGFAPLILIALLAAAAGLGGLAGAAAATWARHRSPQLIVLLTAAFALAVTVITAIFFNLWWALGVAFAGAFAQELGKLALDAIVQREIGEEVRSSTFGVVEALLQVAWVFGGLVGLALSLTENGRAGLLVLAALSGIGLVWLSTRQRVRVRARDARARAERDYPSERDRPDHDPPTESGHRRPGCHDPADGDRTVPVSGVGEIEVVKTTKPLTRPHGP